MGIEYFGLDTHLMCFDPVICSKIQFNNVILLLFCLYGGGYVHGHTETENTFILKLSY